MRRIGEEFRFILQAKKEAENKLSMAGASAKPNQGDEEVASLKAEMLKEREAHDQVCILSPPFPSWRHTYIIQGQICPFIALHRAGQGDLVTVRCGRLADCCRHDIEAAVVHGKPGDPRQE